jgi:hypothetical protein
MYGVHVKCIEMYITCITLEIKYYSRKNWLIDVKRVMCCFSSNITALLSMIEYRFAAIAMRGM